MLPLHQSPDPGESLGTRARIPSEADANICSRMVRRTAKEYELAKALRARGLGDRAISRELGIPSIARRDSVALLDSFGPKAECGRWDSNPHALSSTGS
jgi:hypothetical protein